MARITLRMDKHKELFYENGLRSFEDFMEFTGGATVASKRGRRILRLEMGGRAFYLKQNRLNWVELFKTVSRFRLPPRNARREWNNLFAVGSAGIATAPAVAMGEKTFWGFELCSFVMTEELYGARSLMETAQGESEAGTLPARRHDEVLPQAQHERKSPKGSSAVRPELVEGRRHLIRAVADMARRLHRSGMHHQDFYLSHIYLGSDGTLYLIDLQRVRRYRSTPRHYVIKDLAQLNYSAHCVSRTDRIRFLLAYLDTERLKPEDKALVRKIQRKTNRIARHTVKLLERRRRRGELSNGLRPPSSTN